MSISSTSNQSYASSIANDLAQYNLASASGGKVATTSQSQYSFRIAKPDRNFNFEDLAPRRQDTSAIWSAINQLLTIIQSLIEVLAPLLQKSNQVTPPAQTPGSVSSEDPISTDSPKTPDGSCVGAKDAPTETAAADNTFLWKPVSDKDGKLAVLLPSELLGEVKSVKIIDPKTKKVIETGKAAGKGNGNRAHFRFNKAGGKYPDGAIVKVTLNDGTTKSYTIKETSNRLEKK